MGYRNETEQLRAKVQRLEAQVGAIRGQVTGGRATRFASRVRRQAWVIGVAGVLASGLALLCVVPTGVQYATLERVSVHDVVERSAADLPAEVVIDVQIDEPAVSVSEWGWYAPSQEDPRLLVYCDWDHCPDRLMHQIRSGPRPVRTRDVGTLTGPVEAVRPGQPVAGLGAHHLAAHAAAIGEPVESLRVLSPAKRADPAGPFWVFLVMSLMVMLGAGAAFLLHRRGVRQEVQLPTSDDFLPRSAPIAALLYMFTGGLYQFYWIYRTTGLLRRLTGRPDLVPAVDLVLSCVTLGFWNFWAYYRNAEAIDELYADRGEPSSVRASVVGYSIATFVCGLAYVGLVHELQSQYNRLASDQGDAMQDALDRDPVDPYAVSPDHDDSEPDPADRNAAV